MTTEMRVCVCENSEARIRKEPSQCGWVWMDALPLAGENGLPVNGFYHDISTLWHPPSHNPMEGCVVMS